MHARHYGMDWLRIGAFALLILYHVAMVFVPWDFHVKAVPTVRWATYPMLAVNAWRLVLLFVVSGYASRALFARSRGAGGFAWNRTGRLAVPLLFGIAVVVPPQAWVELVTRHGYPDGYLAFWTRDYFAFRIRDGVMLPAWNHLWFVAYLWAYTLLLAAAIPLARRLPLQRWYDAAFGGIGVLLVPMAWYVLVHGRLLVMARETQMLVDDAVGHATYLPALLFGFGLAGSPRALAAAVRWRHLGLAIALLGYAGVIGVEAGWPGDVRAPRWIYPYYGAARGLQQWGAIVALIGLAERHLNRDHRWRATLTEAVFPFYLVHQTIIVVGMYALLRLAVPQGAQFAVLVAATAAGCWLFYLGGRAIPPLRPLIGLRRAAPRATPGDRP